MGIRSPLNLLFAFVIFTAGLWPSLSEAQKPEPTRRAFLVGNLKYNDSYIVRLERTVNDAKDLAKDLEDVGFDKKNIKVVIDIKNKAAFDKEFDAFLKTVNPGDFVLFYFSGHGFGVEALRRNYLLFTDLKSPFTFTRGKMSDDERRNADLVRVRIPRYIPAYQTDEIPNSGISTADIEARIAEKDPGNVLMILDACRSLARTDLDQVEEQRVTVKRSSESGSRLITDEAPRDKFMVLYAAQFGEQAIEGFSELGRNSLFTEILRTELPRPGQSIRGLANRVKLIVRQSALAQGRQQEPEFVVRDGAKDPDSIRLVASIGAGDYPIEGGNCSGSATDWARIKDSRNRDLLDRHLRRFVGCRTVPEAEREYIRLSLVPDDKPEETACDIADTDWRKIGEIADAKDANGAHDPKKLLAVWQDMPKKDRDELLKLLERLDLPATFPDAQKALVYLLNRHTERFLGCRTVEVANKQIGRIKKGLPKDEKATAEVTLDKINLCDELAASDTDSALPPEVPGVPFEKLKTQAEEAIKACEADFKKNDRVTRFLFNRARAHYALALRPRPLSDAHITQGAFELAGKYYKAASEAGYISALNDLAVLYEAGDVAQKDDDEDTPIKLFARGAEQGHPLAMYNYAMHLRHGQGVRRDLVAAAEWFSKAADAGYVSAMVEIGRALVRGEGASNPRRGMEWLLTAANQGATRAKFLLGVYYFNGADDRVKGKQSVNSIKPDPTLSLLWLGRLAEVRDRLALRWLAELLQDGDGLSSPQPEIAERYWRLAAYAGDPYAQVVFADRLRRGSALSKPQFGSNEAIDLLERAVVQGEAMAALGLAQIYRGSDQAAGGSRPQQRNVRKAMEYAYRAIELAVLSEKDVESNGERLPEIGAAHLLIELVKDPQYPEQRKLLHADEIERLERYYGATDENGKVKIRRLDVMFTCHVGEREWSRRQNRYVWPATWEKRKTIWVWDWGRAESPTEFQFRALERADSLCTDNDLLRRTLIDIFDQSKKSGELFTALVEQKIKTARGENNPTKPKKERRGRGRRYG